MAKRGVIFKLPDDVRKGLDRKLIKNSFGGYTGLAQWLQSKGYNVCRNSVWSYGNKMESRLQAIRDSTEAAKMIAEEAADNADARSEAVMSMVQTEMFGMLMNLRELDDEEDPAKRVELMGRAARSIADLTRASVAQKKWRVEVEREMRKTIAEEAANRVEASAKQAGVSPETIAIIRRDVLMMGGE